MTPPTISLDCRGAAFDPATFWLAIGLVWAILILVAFVAVRVWVRFAAFGSGWGCLGGFAAALLGMTGWMWAVVCVVGGAVAMARLLASAVGVAPSDGSGGLAPWLVPALVIAVVCVAVVESPPMREMVWDQIEPSARRTRVVLMASLGLFGTAIGPAVGLLWVVYMYLSFGSCDRFGW